MRSMKLIIHTRDNIFNVVRPNCLHPWTREKFTINVEITRVQNTNKQTLIPSPETTQFPCSLIFNPWNKSYPINSIFFPTLPHILTNLKAHSDYIFLIVVILKVKTHSIFIEPHYLVTKKSY